MGNESYMKTKILCSRFQITSSPIVSAAKEAAPVDFTKGYSSVFSLYLLPSTQANKVTSDMATETSAIAKGQCLTP